MLLNIGTVELMFLLLVTACLAGLIAYVANSKLKARREQENTAAISKAIIGYFRKSGVDVTVGCVSIRGDNRFTALIESEPMKRFRLSHIIEITLRDHVHKTCDLELEEIYWRFPIKEAVREVATQGVAATQGNVATQAETPAEEAVRESKPGETTDEYINEGLVHYKDLPKFEVTEISWETFEEATTVDSTPKSKPKA